jgi:hypothetical protein
VSDRPLSTRVADNITGPVFLVLAPVGFVILLIIGARTGELTANFKSGANVVFVAILGGAIGSGIVAWALGWAGARLLLLAAASR